MSSELRTHLLTQMDLHGLAPNTQRGYLMSVKALAAYYKESPEKLTDEQIRAYFHHLLKERKLTKRSCHRYLTGLIFFYRHVCKRQVNDRFGLPSWRSEKKLPIVLSIEEVTRLLSCEHNLKHRVLLKTIYSAGLRVSEAVRLQPRHIESDPSRMLIRIEDGKGKKDRYTVLSKNLLKELRLYWKRYRPEKWLFPGHGGRHLTTAAASQVFYNAKKSRHNENLWNSQPPALLCDPLPLPRNGSLYDQQTPRACIGKNHHHIPSHHPRKVCRTEKPS